MKNKIEKAAAFMVTKAIIVLPTAMVLLGWWADLVRRWNDPNMSFWNGPY